MHGQLSERHPVVLLEHCAHHEAPYAVFQIRHDLFDCLEQRTAAGTVNLGLAAMSCMIRLPVSLCMPVLVPVGSAPLGSAPGLGCLSVRLFSLGALVAVSSFLSFFLFFALVVIDRVPESVIHKLYRPKIS